MSIFTRNTGQSQQQTTPKTLIKDKLPETLTCMEIIDSYIFTIIEHYKSHLTNDSMQQSDYVSTKTYVVTNNQNGNNGQKKLPRFENSKNTLKKITAVSKLSNREFYWNKRGTRITTNLLYPANAKEWRILTMQT
jgi:hypothetical protein